MCAKQKRANVRTELGVDNNHGFFPLALLNDLFCQKLFEALSKLSLLHRGDIFNSNRGRGESMNGLEF